LYHPPNWGALFSLKTRHRVTIKRSFCRLLPLILAVLALSILVAGDLAQRSSAQVGKFDREAAFSEKADKVLKRVRRAVDEDRAVAAKGRLRRENSEIVRLSRNVGVERRRDNTVSIDVVVRLSDDGAAELKAAGFAVAARVGDIATLQTDVDRLPELASLSSVRNITAAVYRRPLNDRARQAVGIDGGSGQRVVSQTGRGVVVGIIDTGIDFRHLDFTVPESNGRQTRIKALLDMTVYGTQAPDPNWNYSLPGQSALIGHLYTAANLNTALQSPKPADQNSDLVKQRDKNGHGTHVAGIAAGNGLSSPTPGTYAGMAPEADLIIVKASRQNDSNDDFRTTDVINALQFIQQKASELGEPFVVNMSLGGHAGSPHDGTDPDERAIDNIVSSGTGRAVCVAAGNEGQSGMHASGSVSQGSDITLTFTDTNNPNSLTLYYPNSDRFSLTVTMPNGSTLASGPFNGAAASNQYLTIHSGTDDKQDSDSSNDQSVLFVDFKSGAEALGSVWGFTLHGDAISSGGIFNAWMDEFEGGFSAPYLDDSTEVGSPGTARGAITVGAYVTRSATQTIGNYAFFTSPGPTADLRQKPEISAPGYYLYSARSTDVADPNFGTIGSGANASTDSVHYTGLAGTSMATPVTTGSVAVLLQAASNLTIDQVKTSITNSADHDGFDPVGWNAQFGFGKLNVAAAIAAATAANPIDDARTFITWHYRDFLSREPDPNGLDYWSSQIAACGSNANCIYNQRVGVSAAFFIELEFQQTGSFVYRLYKGGLGRQPNYGEFSTDRSQVPGGAGLEASKQAFALTFVQRPEFGQKYAGKANADSFVDALIVTIQQASGIDISSQRNALISKYNTGSDMNQSRALALRDSIDNNSFYNAVYNQAFVLMQYFGYLHRDIDQKGYLYWLDILNNKVPNNYRGMVCAFITSTEYQLRFGSLATQNDLGCSSLQ
jgi:subtilisin family serine protease